MILIIMQKLIKRNFRRPKVKPSEILLKSSINNNVSVCITGAGGSIEWIMQTGYFNEAKYY